MIKHVSILVKGKVQGVFFRASAKEKADEIGVKGFVRNQLNGDVYIEAEADQTQLTEFISWCKHGPRRANVESCLVEYGKMVDFTEFKIQR